MKRISFLFLLFFYSQFAFSWGFIGHKIVAQLAENKLTNTAKEKIKYLLPDISLADVSSWADIVRNDPEFAFTKPWHFINIADNVPYSFENRNPDGDIIDGLQRYVATLKSKFSTQEEKVEALKFVIHFIGDLHQPLHVGRAEDRGGNSIKIKFVGRSMNLHSLWDSGMIDYQSISYADYARNLEQTPRYFKNISYEDYDLEELSLSEIIKEDTSVRKQIYDFKNRNVNEEIILTEEYYKKNLTLLNNRLYLAGSRLALILNSVFK